MLKLKNQYKGLTITRSHKALGTITFDSNKVNESEYQFYYNNGFKDLFTKGKTIKYKGV